MRFWSVIDALANTPLFSVFYPIKGKKLVIDKKIKLRLNIPGSICNGSCGIGIKF